MLGQGYDLPPTSEACWGVALGLSTPFRAQSPPWGCAGGLPLCGEGVAHLAAAPSSPLQPLDVVDFIDFNLKRFPEAPLGAAQGAIHPADAGTACGLPHGGGGVERQRGYEPPSLRTWRGLSPKFVFLISIF